jgi:IclR family pca regulon transcriptional regulator
MKLSEFTEAARLGDDIREVRSQGWSLVDQELEAGLRSLSVPIRNGQGDVVAALNVCAPSVRHSIKNLLKAALPELLEASNQITRAFRS